MWGAYQGPCYNEYGCRLFLNGTKRKVVADARVPVLASVKLFCARSAGLRERVVGEPVGEALLLKSCEARTIGHARVGEGVQGGGGLGASTLHHSPGRPRLEARRYDL